jgi:hypothetical protein
MQNFHTPKISELRGILSNSVTRNSVSAEFLQFRIEYEIHGSTKNIRNSVSAEFRKHPSYNSDKVVAICQLLLSANGGRPTVYVIKTQAFKKFSQKGTIFLPLFFLCSGPVLFFEWEVYSFVLTIFY